MVWLDPCVQALCGVLQGSPAAQAPPFLRYVDPVDAEESCPQPSSLPSGLAPAPRHSPRQQAPAGTGRQQQTPGSSAGGGTAAAQRLGPGQRWDLAEAAETETPAGVVPLPSMRPSRAPTGQPRVPGPHVSLATPVHLQQAGTGEVQIEGEPSFGGDSTAAAGPSRLGEDWRLRPAPRVKGGKDLDYRGGRAPLGQPSSAEAGEVRKAMSEHWKGCPRLAVRPCRSLSRGTLLQVPTC